MAYTVDWNSKVVTIPPDDLTLVQSGPPVDVRRLDVDTFRKAIRSIEASEEGIVYQPIVDNVEPTPVDSQTTLARVVRVINGYKVKFDDASGDYMAQMSGGNTNLADLSVLEPTGVSVLSANSAGLIVTTSGGGGGGDVNVVSVAGTPVSGPDDFKASVMDLYKLDVSIEDDGSGRAVQVWRDDAGNELFRRYLYRPDGSHVPFSDYPTDAVVRRGP